METVPTPDPYFYYVLSGLLGVALLAVLTLFLNRLIAMLDRHDKEIIKLQMDQIKIKAHLKMDEHESN